MSVVRFSPALAKRPAVDDFADSGAFPALVHGFYSLRWVPSAITLHGLAFGIAGAMLFPSTQGLLLLGVSLLLDCADGWAARKLDAVSGFGAALDLLSDVAIGCLLAVVVFGAKVGGAVSLAIVLLASASAASLIPRRVSGRTAITFAAAAVLCGCVLPVEGEPNAVEDTRSVLVAPILAISDASLFGDALELDPLAPDHSDRTIVESAELLPHPEHDYSQPPLSQHTQAPPTWGVQVGGSIPSVQESGWPSSQTQASPTMVQIGASSNSQHASSPPSLGSGSWIWSSERSSIPGSSHALMSGSRSRNFTNRCPMLPYLTPLMADSFPSTQPCRAAPRSIAREALPLLSMACTFRPVPGLHSHGRALRRFVVRKSTPVSSRTLRPTCSPTAAPRARALRSALRVSPRCTPLLAMSCPAQSGSIQTGWPSVWGGVASWGSTLS